MKVLILWELKHSQMRFSKHLTEETEIFSPLTTRVRLLYEHYTVSLSLQE